MATAQPEERAKEIFLDAAELPPLERNAYVADACDEDTDLAQRVQKLLSAHEKAEDWLGSTDTWTHADQVIGRFPVFEDEVAIGAEIDGYRLVQQLGEGGFGTVWLAEQAEPVKRRVALKVLKAGLDTKEVIARFEAERQALALMEHPYIAKVYDGGTTERGRPYFVMELVEGKPITEYCESEGLGIRDRLKLFLDVCRAVQHAHQKGLIHRDIKPSNVMVCMVDGRAVPKVIDFGIAKATGGSLTEKTVFTRGGQMMGTPTYMSPEQVEGAMDIDTRTDVYSLGVLLYEVLSGRTPFDQETLNSLGIAEVMRVIREVEPPLPSARMNQDKSARAAQLRAGYQGRHLRGDLDWIVMQCMDKNRERRYDSVAVLANDLRRYLRGEPVLAGPPNISYKLSKFVVRHGWFLVLALTFVGLLVGGVVYSNAQAGLARTEQKRSASIADFLEHVLLSVDPAYARSQDTELMKRVLRIASERMAEASEERPPIVEATLRRVIGGAYTKIAEYELAESELRRALSLRLLELGPDHEDTLRSQLEWGSLMLQMDRFVDADEPLNTVYTKSSELLGEDHEIYQSAISTLAILLRKQGEVAKAADLLIEQQDYRARTLGEKHDDTVLTMNNLAGVLEELGRYEEAAHRYRRAYEINYESHGEEDPRTLKAINNLAGVYREQNQLDQAEPLLIKALEIKERILPEGHPSVLVGMNNLADLWEAQGKYDDAEVLYRRGWELGREKLGESSERVMILRYNLASMWNGLGQYDKAEPMLREVVRLTREHIGHKRPLTASAENALALLLLKTERYVEAESYARQAVQHGDHIFPPGHPARAVFRVHLGQALAHLARDQEALGVLETAFEIVKDRVDSEWRRKAMDAIADIHAARGREAEAAHWRDLE